MTTADYVKMLLMVIDPRERKPLSLEQAAHDIDVMFADDSDGKPSDLSPEKYLLTWNTALANETNEEKIGQFVTYHFNHVLDGPYWFCETFEEAKEMLDAMRANGETIPDGLTPEKFWSIWQMLTVEFYNQEFPNGEE